VLQSGVIPIIFNFNKLKDKLVEPPLRILGNLLAGNAMQCEQLIGYGCISYCSRFLNNKFSIVRREAAWCLSNIAAGTLSQIQALVQSDVIPKLCELVKGSDLEVAREAMWVISNCLSGADLDTSIALVKLQVIDTILFVVSSISDQTILGVTLEGLRQLFIQGEALKMINESNPFVQNFNNKGGMEYLSRLQCHQSEDVYKSTTEILLQFYDVSPMRMNESQPI
jgi:uncharacterized protein YuzB (UPF0349 family)